MLVVTKVFKTSSQSIDYPHEQFTYSPLLLIILGMMKNRKLALQRIDQFIKALSPNYLFKIQYMNIKSGLSEKKSLHTVCSPHFLLLSFAREP